MDMEKAEVDKFIGQVKKKFSPESIILFGSRATGNAWKYSDYDFIIVSKKFKGVHWLDRISKTVKLWTLLQPIDILPYTPEEFKEKKISSSVVRTAIKQGRVVS